MNAVAENFGRAADDYDVHAPVQRAMAEWLAGWLPEQRHGVALEVGAGTGLFTACAQPWAGGYVATDASAAMVARGRARGLDVDWRELAAENIGSGPWDWILSSSVLQWAEEPAAVLRGWRLGLSAQGRVLAGFYVADTLPELHELVGDRGPVAWRTSWAWRDAFREAGLRVLRDDVARRTFAYGSARGLLRSLHGVGAAPRRLVPPARLLGWLRARGDEPMTATWTFYRCEAEPAEWLVDKSP